MQSTTTFGRRPAGTRHRPRGAAGAVPGAATAVAILFTGAAAAQTTIQVPSLDTWNDDTNALTVNPGSPADGRTYLYPDETTRNTDAAGAADGTGSRAFITWEIDTGLGESPGIQVVTEDLDFPRRNCVMASGTDATSGEEKTCSDPQGSAKRFRLTLTEADEPVDIVFNTAMLDKVYDDGIDPTADDFEVGRIYRLIQKLVNDTGQRIQGVRIEVGFGTGDDFEPASFADDHVAFELRSEVDRKFFGEADVPLPKYIDAHRDPDADCAACHEDADGPSKFWDIWQPGEYATFSPKMFDILNGGRFIDRAGYFDNDPAGLVPPQDVEDIAADKTQFIASIDSPADPDGATGIIGPTTPNYFDMPDNQAAGAGISGNIFGYLLPDSLIASGIYVDDDGDPATEGELLAWWDGNDWRRGNDRDFARVPEATLAEWAERPLSEDEVLEPPRYEVAPIDDVAALNVDAFLYIGDAFDTTTHDTLTVRYEATPVTADTVEGTGTPPWALAGNEAPELSTYAASDDADDDGGSSGAASDDADDDGGSSGCAYSPGAPFDPLLPTMLAGAIGWLAWRRLRDGRRE